MSSTARRPHDTLFRPVPVPIRRTVTQVLERASEAPSEDIELSATSTRHFNAHVLQLNWSPYLTLNCAFALLLSAYAFSNSRAGGPAITDVFLPTLALMFAPIALRLLLPTPSRSERIILLCVIGLACYLIKILANPAYFTFYDEFLHWRTVDDIARSHHLFTMNALLPVSPYYPGLEIVTNALSTASGLSSFYAGLVVVGVARLLMVLALFALNEQLLSSTRVASLATLLYMINPHFLLFDAQYGYESLALPLAALLLFALSPHQSVSVRLARLKPLASLVKFSKTKYGDLQQDLRWITVTVWLVLVAIVFTHHVTDYFFDALLVIWTIIYVCKRLTPFYRSTLVLTTLLALTLSLVTSLMGNNPVIGYLTSFMSVALDELGHIVSGTGSAKQLFSNYSGPPTPLWERMMMITSMGIIVASLPFGLLCLWRRYRDNALVLTFGFFSLLYPLSQAFRLTNSGAEVADRAAAFLFIPIATVLAVCIAQLFHVKRLRWFQLLTIMGTMTYLFVGGVVLGNGPDAAALPGPYEALADMRSIEPQGIQAALWTNTYLGPDNRVATDRINQILLGTYGEQRVVTSIADDIDLSSVFLSDTLDDEDRNQLRQADIHYLLVDNRLTRYLPLLGYYYEMDEVDAFHHKTPVDEQAFAKFATSPQMNRIYDGGDIVIYNVRGQSLADEK